ncbi:TonB-dependent receptor [Acidipila sp. EB88]|uniref:TonB-dependent receptor n=1 Tax=Acidipila sp. EB88 TaxID=2305226 RepID=UPI0013154705|nr:TonB-dependent receptor [Acidipila sp. EB88]
MSHKSRIAVFSEAVERRVCFGMGVALVAGSLLLSTSPVALAQATTGDVTGTVTDNTGATIPNATVTLTNLGTNEKRTAQTGPSGDYTFSQLGPGTYSLQVAESGFNTLMIPSVNVAVGDRAREDAKLQIGSEATTVQVTGQTPALQADNSVLSTLVTQQQVQDLPLNGRNFINLAQIVPGANEGPGNGLTSGARPDDRRQTSSVSANGQSEILNDELVDGLDNNDRIIGTIGIRPSIESIREINIQTNTYTAEAGRTAGAVINVITKSGSNTLHGSAFEFFRNDVLDAYPFQFGAHLPKPKLRQNQFGASIGGPILKDKLFFFGDYEGLRQIRGTNPTVSQVPTAAEYNALHSGDAAQILALAHGGDTTGPNAANGGVDPVGLDYALLYPQSNSATGGVPGVSDAYVSSPTTSLTSDTADGRVDYQYSAKDLIFGRYTYNRVPSTNPGLLPNQTVAGVNVAPGGAIFNFYGTAKDDAQNAQINYVHTFNASVLLQLGFGYTRINNQSVPLNYGTAVNTAFGQPGINIDQSTSGLAPTSVSGFADLGDGAFIPIVDINNTFQENGSVTINRGAHSYKFGANLIRRQATNAQNNYGNGDYTFNPLQGDVNGLAALLQGNFQSVQRSTSIIPPHWRTWEPGAFAQDDWHVNSKLTLNIGVRYDVFTPFTEVHNALSNFDPATGTIILANVNGTNQYAGLNPTWTNIAPRIGFALTPAPGFVLRGGYGMSYFPENYTSNSSLKAQPFVSNYNCNNGACPVNPATGVAPTRFFQGVPLPVAESATNPTGNINDVVDPGFRTSYAEQFNLTVEKSFGANVFQASYVGVLGRHLAQISNDRNAPALVSNSTLNTLAAQQGSTPAAVYNTLRPFYAQLPGVQNIGQYQSGGSSSYNALQLQLTRRTTAGLTVGANYTYAHALDNVLGFSNEVNDGYGAIPSQLSSVEYGNSDLDIRQRGVVTANYQLPFGKNLHGIAAAAGKGWQANTLLAWSTGQPFTVITSQGISGTSNAATAGRPNMLRGAKVDNPSIERFFDATAFAPQLSGTLGSEQRNPLHGPDYRHVDFSLFKSFPVVHESTIEFRAECFNITNVTNFANPNDTIQVTPSAANPDVYTVTPNNIGTITGTSANYNPRQIQFALKYEF